jgi:3-dehydroquinate synthase
MASTSTNNISLSPSLKQQQPIHLSSLQNPKFLHPHSLFCHPKNHFPKFSSLSTPLRSPICASSSQLMDPFSTKIEPGVPTIVNVDLGNRSYPIYIGSGLLNKPELLQR